MISIFSIIMVFLILGYESRIINRVINKYANRNIKYMEPMLNFEYFIKIRNRTIKDLNKLKPLLKVESNICRTEKLIRGGFCYKQNKIHYSHALLAIGLLSTLTDKNYAEFKSIEKYCDKIINKYGSLKISVEYIDECLVGYILCEMYDRTRNEKYFKAAKVFADFLLKEYPQNTIGTLPYFKTNPEIMLVDDKGEICAFLVRYGETFQVPEATALGVRQLVKFLEVCMDLQKNLPYHAYDIAKSRQLGPVGWLRGIGWLCVGLADTLKYLPNSHTDYDYIHKCFLSIILSVHAFQDENMCWKWIIDNTIAHIDTSGTAMIGYAIESAINAGILNESFGVVSENALKSILLHTHENGVVDDALSECSGVGHYPAYFGPSNFSQGPTLALFSLVLYRQGIVLNKS